MELLEKYFDTAFSAPDGIRKLRILILQLAMQGILSSGNGTVSPSEKANQKANRNGKQSKGSQQPIQEPDLTKSTWRQVRLDEIVQVLDSMRKPVTRSDRRPGPYPYYGASGIVDYVSDYIFDEPLVLVGEDGAKWGPGESTAFKISGKTWVNNHAHVLRPHRDLVTDDFLVYCLVGMDLGPFITGMTVPKLNQARLNSIPVALPPIEEQHRIVAKIDQLMARCDELEKLRAARDQQRLDVHAAAIRRLLDAPDPTAFDEAWQFIARHFGDLYAVRENVAGLRKAILQLAVMGRLVPQDEREGTGYNEEQQRLGQSSGEDLGIPIPPSWKLAKLDDLIISIDSGWSPACKPTPAGEGEWGVLKTTAVQPLRFLPHENKALPSNLKPRPAIVPDEGDILITRAGPKNRVGICCVVKNSSPKLMLSDKIVRMKLLQKIIDPDYMALSLSVGMGADQVEHAKSGMAESQMNISQDKIRRITIPLPPMKEQRRIMQKAERLLVLCDKLEHQIAAAELKQDEVLGAVVNQNTF